MERRWLIPNPTGGEPLEVRLKSGDLITVTGLNRQKQENRRNGKHHNIYRSSGIMPILLRLKLSKKGARSVAQNSARPKRSRIVG
jgi:hypothetical protein